MENDMVDIHRTHFTSAKKMGKRERGDVERINGVDYVWTGAKWMLLEELIGKNNLLSKESGRSWD